MSQQTSPREARTEQIIVTWWDLLHYTAACAELWKKKKEAAPAAKRPQGALCFLLTKKTNKQTERYSEVMSVETEEKQTKAEAAIALFGNCCC